MNEIEFPLNERLLKKDHNKAGVFKPSTKYYAEEMRELWVTGGHEPDVKESGYSKEYF